MLRENPPLFQGLRKIPIAPEMEMAPSQPMRYRRNQLDNLARWIDQAFEIQGYSEAKTLGAASQQLGTPVQGLDRIGNRLHLVAQQLRARSELVLIQRELAF
jgi:hypothetical protein